jgi:hypothetical protein
VIGEKALCLWPGLLRLEINRDAGRFEQRLAIDRELEVELPGSREHWPERVRVDGRIAAVLERAGTPVVRVEAGEHRVQGAFLWSEVPEVIQIPKGVAGVALQINGKPVAFPERDRGNKLWLRQSKAEQSQSEQLEIKVYRRIDDGVPLIVTTRIALRAGGTAREVNLGKVLLEGTVPLALNADLPTRLEPGGELVVQVQAGTYQVEVVSRTQACPESLKALPQGAPWPAQEVWVWSADEALRQASVSGLPGIDPARTELDAQWRTLPAYLVGPGAKMTWTTVRRGEPDPPPNRLALQRDLWLDLDGRGYTVRDRFSGSLRRGWRLNLLAGDLGRAVDHGVDQLITKTATGGAPGVELRQSALDLTAEWRAEDLLDKLPAVGWSEDVQSLSATLYLPPGWRLFAAKGVDHVQTWLSEWNLLGFFFVLVVALATTKLVGLGSGALALAALVLCQHESGAPDPVWLPLLFSIALLRVLKPGKIRLLVRLGWWASVVALLVMGLPFAVHQVRMAIYPQIEEAIDISSFDLSLARQEAVPAESIQYDKENLERGEGSGSAPVARPSMQQEAPEWLAKRGASDAPGVKERAKSSESRGALKGLPQTGQGAQSAGEALTPDLSAVVQTGPGVPSWRFKQWTLSWSGPVARDQQIRLWLISPALNGFLALLRVVLLALLALRLMRVTPFRPAVGAASSAAGTTPAAISSAALLLSLLFLPAIARGDFPSQELLDQLAERLTRPPACRPNCVSVSALSLKLDSSTLRIFAEANAGEASSFQVPGPAANWTPTAVRLDDRPCSSLALLEDGFIHVRLPPGAHRVQLDGPLTPNDALTLTLGSAPHRVSVDAPSWNVDGLREDGTAAESIQLTRKFERDSTQGFRMQTLPPWLQITRTFEIGKSWKVYTVVTRISPIGSPVVVRYPLLPGESVTELRALVESGELVVSLSRDQREMSWSSSLKERPELTLTAGTDKPWSEIWVVRQGPVWHCNAEGLSAVSHQRENRWEPTFRPWPGESIKLVCDKPASAGGQSITIDAAKLEVTPGIRMLNATLNLDIRSSSGGMRTTTLPGNARVQAVTIDNQPAQFRQQGGAITYTIKPGHQALRLDWQQPEGIATWQGVPTINLGGNAANVHLVINLPSNRWLLWARGPAWGPAILFWGYLIVILLVAIALAKAPQNPLRRWQWVLLALGLTQLPVPAILAIVGWFFALSFREKYPPPERPIVYDLVQLALVCWTFVALASLYGAVHQGLLVQPEMQVMGTGSSDTQLIWYADRVAEMLPHAHVLSVSIWVWKISMLLWSLWLASSLIKWLPWAWRCFNVHGIWKPLRRKSKSLPTPESSTQA